jgi:hypothetical protein
MSRNAIPLDSQPWLEWACKRGWEFHVRGGMWSAERGFVTVLGVNFPHIRDMVEEREREFIQGRLDFGALQPEARHG